MGHTETRKSTALPLIKRTALEQLAHLGSLVVNSVSIEVIHGDVALGADRVRHRAVVLGKLPRRSPSATDKPRIRVTNPSH